jgi:hypothetical protein
MSEWYESDSDRLRDIECHIRELIDLTRKGNKMSASLWGMTAFYVMVLSLIYSWLKF